MTQRVENGTTYAQTFDVENRLVSVAVSGAGTTQYQYDAGGQMLKKIAPDGTVTVYLGLVEYEIDGGVTETTSYYNVPGARVVRVNTELSYVLTDHLGSSSVTLDDNGDDVGQMRYYAYGETRISTGSVPTDRLYTGQLRQGEHGLDYFNARWYIPSTGRFISADTIVPGAANPQAFNRYAFVLGNPLRYTDPSGHCPGLTVAACLVFAGTAVLVVAVAVFVTPAEQRDAGVQAFVNIATSILDTIPSPAAIRTGEGLTDDEEKHVGRVGDMEVWFPEHPDLASDVDAALKGLPQSGGKNHVVEAWDKARQLDRSIGTLQQALGRGGLTDEELAAAGQAIEDALTYRERLRNTLGQFDPSLISRDELLRLLQELKEQNNDDNASDE
jgi:RHS repeat-associated protein